MLFTKAIVGLLATAYITAAVAIPARGALDLAGRSIDVVETSFSKRYEGDDEGDGDRKGEKVKRYEGDDEGDGDRKGEKVKRYEGDDEGDGDRKGEKVKRYEGDDEGEGDRKGEKVKRYEGDDEGDGGRKGERNRSCPSEEYSLLRPTDFKPASSEIELEIVTFTGAPVFMENGTFHVPNPGKTTYTGPPSPEIDNAWEEITAGRYFRITAEEAIEAFGSASDVYWNDKVGGYMAGIDMFHALHCLSSTKGLFAI
ncbi:hypothetical protein THAR02_05120 [Trichoderma harzianum]|uniref:Uncharacterized protein n=1 Tax=Trichoderma harzianum TaxID=5544 RepID=A0A0F9ZR57_TRIHA|nr:hypothetical protein THAR02_05120 [Trichoderma harzianum]